MSDYHAVLAVLSAVLAIAFLLAIALARHAVVVNAPERYTSPPQPRRSR